MTGRDPVPPTLLGVGTVDPSVPGQPWWRYRRDDARARPNAKARADTVTASTSPSVPAASAATDVKGDDDTEIDVPVEVVVASGRSPLPLVVGGLLMLALLAVGSRGGTTSLGSVVVPIVALLFGSAAAIWQTRAHPDEPWIGRWLIAAVIAKLVASYLRYVTLVVGFEGRAQGGDAHQYHKGGLELALFWRGEGPDPGLPDLRSTNFVVWFDGVVHTIVGNDFLAGFLVFGLLACVGSYMWYRGAADVVPILDKKLYFAFVMFAPSILFWPASIGKEALMQLGIGALTLGLARLMARRLVPGLLISAAGGWLVWVVRPHLIAIVALAGGFAYLVGRVRADRGGVVLGRPIGIVVVALLVGLMVSQGAEYLGLEDFSLNSIEESLNEQTERTSTGGSKFDPGSNSLSPLNLPQRAVNVLMRPFPWEVETGFQLLASIESMVLVGLIVTRFASVRASLRNARAMPFLLYAWVLTVLYCAAYAAFANFGLLVRQRSLVFPAVFLLLSIDPLLAKRYEDRAREELEHEPVAAGPGGG